MLALDESGDDDTVIEDQGYTLCINTDLYKQVATVTIDYSHMGFNVEPGNPLPGAGAGGCGGCASSGGCSTGH